MTAQCAVVILLAALVLGVVMSASHRLLSLEAPPKLRAWDRRVWPFPFLGFASVTVIILLQISFGVYCFDRVYGGYLGETLCRNRQLKQASPTCSALAPA